jgi:glycosyltransferase involved in cell wall biosynthesis
MRLNVIGSNFRRFDGYGRFAGYLVRALRRAGHEVTALLADQIHAPAWLQAAWGIDWHAPAISIMPPFYLLSTPGPGAHWLYTMTEGSVLPEGWAETINESNVSRVIVPCQHNATVFRAGGVNAPVSVIHGGTEPDDFPLLPSRHDGRPPFETYTFLALADRGARKGWVEVWAAFYRAFGSPTDTPDVRLIVKSRPGGNDMLDLIAGADNPDPRVTILIEDLPNVADYYAMGDCFVAPSRSEGWGMPHREAAASALPVITQAYSGMDDGFTDFWALTVRKGHLEPIPARFEHIAGEWRKADVQELADLMRWCYHCPDEAAEFGEHAAAWIRDNQTWAHTAANLVRLLESEA